MTDSSTQITTLRTIRLTISDPGQAAVIDALIATLEEKLRSESRAHTQSITGNAHLGVAVAGDARDILAPSVEAGASGVNIANTITIIYQQAPPTVVADHEKMLRDYLTYLQRTYQSISLRGIGDDVLELPLSELYISLTLSEPSSAALFNREIMRRITGLFKSETPGDDDRLERGDVLEWSELMRRHRRMVVVGAPGSGKSTLLQYTALELVNAMLGDHRTMLPLVGLEGEPPLVPLLLPLRHMTPFLRGRRSDELLGEGAALLLQCLTTIYRNESMHNLPDDFFMRLCEEGRAILLLDGLDEVTSTQDRERVSTSIRSLLRRFGQCRCVITSRTHAYEGDARLSDVRVCAIAPMNEDQQQRFLTNWSRCVHEYRDATFPAAIRTHRAQQFTDQIWRAMVTNERIGRLRDNPLLLTIIAVIYYARRDLPENRAALYDECLRVLLRGGRDKVDSAAQERARYSGTALLLGMEARRDLLSFVAYTMHQSGRKRLPTAEFDRAVADYMAKSLDTRHEAEQFAAAFRTEALKHAGVLDELELGQYGFIHLTIQEYLTAYHIAGDQQRWDALVREYRKDWWREVILLCAGILPREQCWLFLEQLITRRPNTTRLEYSEALGLAAQALAEIEKSKSMGPVRNRVRDEAMKLLSVSSANVRVASGRVLAIVGDPRPGVCDLERMPFVVFGRATFVIGSTAAQADLAGKNYEHYWLKQGNKERAKQARTWPQDEINQHATQLEPFELARYPLTNAQYKRFIDGDGYNLERPWWDAAARDWLARDDAATEGLESWQRREHKDQPEFWTTPEYGNARSNHPVVGISWYEAMAYCRWLTEHLNDGLIYRLPSEAEWEYAARGMQRQMYPWGDTEPDGERANFNYLCNGTSAVGCFPTGATAEGLMDMAGNVWEWTRSEYRPYPYNPDDGREDGTDPADKFFTFRGGGWDIRSIFLRASLRDFDSPVSHFSDFGFRLARHKQ